MTRLLLLAALALGLTGCFAFSKIGDKSKGAASDPYFATYRKTVPDEIRRGVEAGDAGAQAAAGYFHDKGEYGFPQRDDEALRLYRLAAAQGNPAGLTNLAVFLSKGREVKRDDVEAARLFSLAARQDFEPAQVYLAAFYLTHRGKIDDGDTVAIAALRAVAAREVASTRCWNVGIVVALARLYQDGAPGVPRDQTEAIRLLKKMAAPRGDGCDNENAKAQLAKIPANSPLNRQ